MTKDSTNNFILVSLDDEKSKAISEVLGSSTCKKIISYLTETKEASQKDLSDALKIPMNTVEYNIKKLLDSGFIQKRTNFFWSKKGKKIIMYELSNKSIVISHKKFPSEKIKSILPAFILTAAGTFALWAYEKISSVSVTPERVLSNSYDAVATKAQELAGTSSGGAGSITASVSPSDLITSSSYTPLWLWFLIGGLISIFVISLVNWRKL